MPTFFVKGGNMEEWKVISRFPDYKTKVSEIAQMYNVTQGAIYRILTAVKRKDKYEQIRQRYSINKAI